MRGTLFLRGRLMACISVMASVVAMPVLAADEEQTGTTRVLMPRLSVAAAASEIRRPQVVMPTIMAADTLVPGRRSAQATATRMVPVVAPAPGSRTGQDSIRLVAAADAPAQAPRAVQTAAAAPAAARAPARTAAAAAADDRQLLLQRLQQLEQRLNQLENRPQAPAAPAPSTMAMPAPEPEPGAIVPTIPGQQRVPVSDEAANLDTRAIIERLEALDQRLQFIETNTVISEPKTVVRQREVYVDERGNQFDEPAPDRRPVLTYQRERVFRRQSIGEEIEDALATEGASGVTIGVSTVTSVQGAVQTRGARQPADGRIFGVTQADITFLAQSAALNTSFFADVVAIGGPGPDGEIPSITLLNSQLARLSNNRLQMREAWLRTELFNQRLGVTVGQLDLTNYFDRNAVANDETFAFISDALVNNQALGLRNNGLGAALVYDPKSNYLIKFGVQQSEADPSNPIATNLSSNRFAMAEIEYITTPFNLPEGRYRLWGRLDNAVPNPFTGANQERSAWGVSADQKITPTTTLFGRFGNGDVGGVRVKFYSGGVGFRAPFAINPLDAWGLGYAKTEFVNGASQHLAEAFYNLYLTTTLRLTFMTQYVDDTNVQGSYLLSGTRFAVSF